MKRSILGLMYLIHGMRQTGIPVDQRLKQIGLNANAFDPSAVIHADLEWDILRTVAKDIHPELGLDIGQHYALAGYGPLLMLLLTSSTVEKALKNAIQYQALTHLSGQLLLKKSSDCVALEYQSKQLDQPLGLFRAQSEISGTLKFLQEIHMMAGLVFPEIRVELPFPPPKDADMLFKFQQYYGRELYFDCPYARFVFQSNIMNVGIPSSDAITFRLYEDKCQMEIVRFQEDTLQSTLIESVRDFLDIQRGYIPSMAETAQALNIPERTLRHQLQQQKTSYKDIRVHLIRQKALKLIDDPSVSIERIAEMLGYSESAAFNHAFKRWFGQSPRQYRK